jgi:type I restriction enzyme M protein
MDITEEEFQDKLEGFERNLSGLFANSKALEKEIQENIKKLVYE